MKINLLNGTVDLRKQRYPDSEMHILFAGDVCPRFRTEKIILEGQSNRIIEPAASAFFNKDISIINLETPLTNSDKGIIKTGPVIKVDPYCVNFLKAAKIDVCNLANNHIGDYGSESVLETIELLKQNDIEFVGAGPDLQDARKPLFLFKNGLRAAVLSYAENEFGGAEKNKPGSSTLCPIQSINQVKEVSSQADITIVLNGT